MSFHHLEAVIAAAMDRAERMKGPVVSNVRAGTILSTWEVIGALREDLRELNLPEQRMFADALGSVCHHPRCDEHPAVVLCPGHLAENVRDKVREVLTAEAESRAQERRKREDELEDQAVVYYLQRPDGLIKIGFSGVYERRFRDLNRDHGPLTELATHAGGRQAEGAIHRQFHADRVVGEWFRPSAALLSHVARVKHRRDAA